MAELTMLNSMAHRDFITSLDLQQSWGIRLLDLKDSMFGNMLLDLTEQNAAKAKLEMDRRGQQVYCFSTVLFDDDVEKGETHFIQQHMSKLSKALAIARILQPCVIRLIAARCSRRRDVRFMPDYVRQQHPWLYVLYREAIDTFYEAGYQVTIENECHNCILSSSGDIPAFFDELKRPERVFFTYDVQNLWQMGEFPTLEVYRELRPYIGYFHVKGGQAGEDGRTLQWRSSLEEASWPVAEMTREVLRDGVSNVICLNSSHGMRRPGYSDDDVTQRDLAYMTGILKEMSP